MPSDINPSLWSQDVTGLVLRKALDANALRQRVIANNLANVDTPNYKAVDVSFSEQLRAALHGGSGERHGVRSLLTAEAVNEIEPVTVFVNEGAGRNDGNTVNVDLEMTKLAETAGAYQTAAELLRARLEMLRTAINEGRR